MNIGLAALFLVLPTLSGGKATPSISAQIVREVSQRTSPLTIKEELAGAIGKKEDKNISPLKDFTPRPAGQSIQEDSE